MVAGPLTLSDQSFGPTNVFPRTVVFGVSAARRPDEACAERTAHTLTQRMGKAKVRGRIPPPCNDRSLNCKPGEAGGQALRIAGKLEPRRSRPCEPARSCGLRGMHQGWITVPKEGRRWFRRSLRPP